jgi:hypothetical protein
MKRSPFMKIRFASCTALVAVLALGSPAWAAKVTVCHVPPGNPANSHAISISENAVQTHLNHGDFLGECCPCWEVSELQSVTAENQFGLSCVSDGFFTVIQNVPGSTPDVEGGFFAATDGQFGVCETRDLPPNFLPITPQQAENCQQQIRARCAAIGTPIP